MLRVGSTEFPVALLDESADGLGVLAGDPGNLGVNRVGLLKTKTVWFEVRVTYVRRIEPADEGAGRQGLKFRLGLQRLREIPRPDEARIGSWRSRVLGVLLPRDKSGPCTGASLTLLSLTLVLAVLIFVTTAWTHVRPMMAGWLHGRPAGVDRAGQPPAAPAGQEAGSAAEQRQRWEHLAQ
ncbi:MAG: hypothetical protein ABSG86_17285 [Thermoguttaceae bacterium]